MTAAQRWVVVVALASFAAGLVVGLTSPAIVSAFSGPAELVDADEQFVREFATRYELSPQQTRLVRAVLTDRRRKREQILFSDPQRLPPELRSEYESAQRLADQLLYELLDERQQAKYREDARPGSGR